MVVFTTLFRNIPGLQPVGVPYALFILAGQVPWTFFTSAVTSSGTSLLAQQSLLTKIYFPRLYVPASNVGAYLVDLAIGLLILGLLLPWYGLMPSGRMLVLPLVILLNFGAAFGLGLIMASLTILFRDLRFVIPFVMQVLMFASPIIYSPSVLPERLRILVAFNPMTGVISAYRWAILGMDLDVLGLIVSITVTLISLAFGVYFFRRTERFFADLL
jgi:lipopolysaccharide transport system permease protein